MVTSIEVLCAKRPGQTKHRFGGFKQKSSAGIRKMWKGSITQWTQSKGMCTLQAGGPC